MRVRVRGGERRGEGEGRCGKGEEGCGRWINGTFPQDVYESFNILMRRKPKENNFKVLAPVSCFSD